MASKTSRRLTGSIFAHKVGRVQWAAPRFSGYGPILPFSHLQKMFPDSAGQRRYGLGGNTSVGMCYRCEAMHADLIELHIRRCQNPQAPLLRTA